MHLNPKRTLLFFYRVHMGNVLSLKNRNVPPMSINGRGRGRVRGRGRGRVRGEARAGRDRSGGAGLERSTEAGQGGEVHRSGRGRAG